MKKKSGTKTEDLLEEYDFSKMSGVRNKYAGKLSGRVVWISLDPDVAKAFPSTKAVNGALRAAMKKTKPSLKTKSRTKAALRSSAA